MDLKALTVFARVAEDGSFSEAARKLGVPKSSVSRVISSLEASLGVRLLHRTTRQVALSTAGAALYERVAPLLVSLQHAVEDLPELAEEPSGLLRVTATPDMGAMLLADVVTRFTARHPRIQVDLHLTMDVVDLVAEGFDVALRNSRSQMKDSSLLARSVGALALPLYASPNYLARKGSPRTPRDLVDHDFVLFRSAGAIRLETSGDTFTHKPHGRITCDDMFFAREAVRSGAGIAMLPVFLADEDVASGKLVRVLPRWSVRSGTLWMVFPEARQVPRKAEAFRAFLMESLRDKPLSPRQS